LGRPNAGNASGAKFTALAAGFGRSRGGSRGRIPMQAEQLLLQFGNFLEDGRRAPELYGRQMGYAHATIPAPNRNKVKRDFWEVEDERGWKIEDGGAFQIQGHAGITRAEICYANFTNGRELNQGRPGPSATGRFCLLQNPPWRLFFFSGGYKRRALLPSECSLKILSTGLQFLHENRLACIASKVDGNSFSLRVVWVCFPIGAFISKARFEFKFWLLFWHQQGISNNCLNNTQ